MYKLKSRRHYNLSIESLESRQLLDGGGLGDFLTSRGNRTSQVERVAEFQTAATGKLPEPKNDQVSIQCYHGPPDAEHWMRFDDFRILRLAD